jgi:hypothetical protein
MARFQLKNQMGLPLRRVRITGSAFTLEPPEQVAESETGQWIANESGTVIYDVASRDGAQNPTQGSAQAPNKPFTLRWDFTAPGQVKARARDVARGVRVQVTQGPTGTLFTVTPRRATFVPLPRHLPAALVPAITALLVLTLATVAFGANLRERSIGSGKTVASGPTSTITATITPSVTPSVTAPITSSVPPHVALMVTHNQSARQNCTGSPAPAYTVTMNSATSNVPVGWQFSAIGGWATASPKSAVVAAGKTATFQVSPIVCPASGITTTYEAALNLSFPKGGSEADIQLTDRITGPAPFANLVVTRNQNASTHCTIGDNYTIDINNLTGNVPVTWQFVPAEYSGPTPWAYASPPSGTLTAGQGTTSITVLLQNWVYCPVTYHATLNLTFPAGGSEPDIPLTDEVAGT